MLKQNLLSSLHRSRTRRLSSIVQPTLLFEYLNAHDEAIEILNGILETNPYNEIARLEVGKQNIQQGKKDEALSAFDFAIISEDTFIGAYIEKAKLLESTGKTNAAIEQYECALKLEDPTSYILVRIAHCHEKLENDQLALQYFKKGINHDPSYEKAWTGIIDFYLAKGEAEKAHYYCEKALNINENYPAYWKRSALLNKTLERYAEAEIAFQNTIEMGNYELLVWLEWLDTLIFLNEWEKAASVGQQAKEFYPDQIELDFRIAGCFQKLGKSIEMEYYLQNVAQHSNDLDEALLQKFPHLRGKLVHPLDHKALIHPMRKNLLLYLKGLLMGAADIVPGVSGGTMALITGIYSELIESIDNLRLEQLKLLKNKGWSPF